jgi:hypothetical protein
MSNNIKKNLSRIEINTLYKRKTWFARNIINGAVVGTTINVAIVWIFNSTDKI